LSAHLQLSKAHRIFLSFLKGLFSSNENTYQDSHSFQFIEGYCFVCNVYTIWSCLSNWHTSCNVSIIYLYWTSRF